MKTTSLKQAIPFRLKISHRNEKSKNCYQKWSLHNQKRSLWRHVFLLSSAHPMWLVSPWSQKSEGDFTDFLFQSYEKVRKLWQHPATWSSTVIMYGDDRHIWSDLASKFRHIRPTGSEHESLSLPHILPPGPRQTPNDHLRHLPANFPFSKWAFAASLGTLLTPA